MRRRLFVWEPLFGGGFDGSSLSSALSPYYVFIYICSLLGFSSLVSSLLFIGAILFVSQSAMMHFLNYMLHARLGIKRIHYDYVVFLGSVMYGFSPYVIGMIAPGHITNLVLFALFPYILCLADEILTAKHIHAKKSLILYILFVLMVSGVSYGIGQVYLLGSILLAYGFFVFLIERLNLLRSILRLLWIYVLLFVSQGWWIIPLLSTYGSLTSINPLNPLNFLLHVATRYATIVNIFLGRAEGILYYSSQFKHYLGIPIAGLFLGVLCLCLLAMWEGRKKKYIWILLSMLTFGLFMTKGDQPPFGNIFLYFYNHIPGFTTFRRPVSKFYWLFLFFYIALAVYGGVMANHYIKKKLYKWILITISFIGVGYLIFAFVKTPFLVPFAIPQYYSEAKEYLYKDNATRILILPGLYGLTPFFNSAVNSFGGTDFLDEAWGIPTVIPDDMNYSPEYPSKEAVNAIGRDIRNECKFCELGKQVMLSHIAVRFDLRDDMSVEDDPQELDRKLQRNPDIANVQTFRSKNGGIKIYSVRKDCRSSLLQLAGKSEATIDYHMVNPTAILITVSHLKDETSLQFLQNYTKNWKLYPYIAQENRLQQTIQIFRQPMFENTHKLVFNYANQWELNAQEIRANLPGTYYSENADGTITIRLLLLYKPQVYFYIGILCSAVFGLFLMVIATITKFNK